MCSGLSILFDYYLNKLLLTLINFEIYWDLYYLYDYYLSLNILNHINFEMY